MDRNKYIREANIINTDNTQIYLAFILIAINNIHFVFYFFLLLKVKSFIVNIHFQLYLIVIKEMIK